VTARHRAHACTLAALLFATAGAYAAPVHATAGIAGLTGAILLTLAAASYHRQHRAERDRHEQARRAATRFPDPKPMPDWEHLAEQARYDETFDAMISHWNEDAA
jgi:hypothetical protein